jgi:hypothetical protein
MKRLIAIAAAAAIFGTVSLAHAGSLGRPCTDATQDKWLAVEALQGKLEQLGYSVRKGKVKNACGEFYAIDRAGNRVELFVDPTNGNIVGTL